jgi:hypothetical protein
MFGVNPSGNHQKRKSSSYHDRYSSLVVWVFSAVIRTVELKQSFARLARDLEMNENCAVKAKRMNE